MIIVNEIVIFLAFLTMTVIIRNWDVISFLFFSLLNPLIILRNEMTIQVQPKYLQRIFSCSPCLREDNEV